MRWLVTALGRTDFVDAHGAARDQEADPENWHRDADALVLGQTYRSLKN